MKVTAIIVNYHSARFLPPLLNILDQDPLVASIIIADNSKENGLAEILKNHRKARLISFSQNIGFAAAVNQAAKTCESDWWLVINPDTLPDKDCVEKLLSGALKTNALIAGPRFFWDDLKTFRLPPALGYSWWVHNGMQSASNFELDARLFSFYWNIRFERFWEESQPFFEPFLSGACMLIKNDSCFFTDGHIFDERYFMYYEDTDLCAEAMKENQHVICVPDAYVVHYWDQSPSSEKPEMMTKSGQEFSIKQYGHPYPVNDTSGYFTEDIEDLGCLTEAPVFRLEAHANYAKLYLEFGLNPFFVPDAQADFEKGTFKFPEPIWNKLSAGTFYTRLREPVLNKTIKTWTWKKV